MSYAIIRNEKYKRENLKGIFRHNERKNIMSSTVHMDEQTPHMHLVFLPVVHTTDKKGNAIDKLDCSEFGKAKDSYRQLQNAFYKHVNPKDALIKGFHEENKNYIKNFQNKHLKRLVETFKKTIKIFIKWICKKFDIAEDYALIRDFEKETRISLDAEKQVKKEDREKEWDLEM